MLNASVKSPPLVENPVSPGKEWTFGVEIDSNLSPPCFQKAGATLRVDLGQPEHI